MFPSVANESLKDRIKQKQWDERFTKGIPEYSPLKDKHTKSYRKLLPQKQKQEQTKPKTTYFQKRMDLLDQLKSLHHNLISQIEDYEELAAKYKLPNYYIYFSLLPLLQTQDPVPYLQQQKKSIKEQSSNFHRISTAIRAREECLERLRKTLSSIKQASLEESKSQLKEQFSHLRFLTVNVIDQIKKWREQIGKVEEKPIFFNDHQDNYLLKLLNDNQFIFTSKLSSALNFAEKNDPFFLVPIKRAEGKQSSIFTQILEPEKQISYYQRYMEYLASEKAYELSINPIIKPKSISKNPIVEKIYKPNQPIRLTETLRNSNDLDEDEENQKRMQLQKMREERLKKNEERIKSIKNIYDNFGKKVQTRAYMSQKKIVETDNEGKKDKERPKKQKIKIRNESQSQFQNMVKLKIEVEKNAKTPLKKARDSKSSSKINNKSEDKMIESLRDIQSTLRTKLQVIQQEDKKEPVQNLVRPAKKNNEEIIKELKAEILSKIQKQALEKERIKKKRRQEQEKVLEEIKAKMKREMEEKLEQKKKEKIIERQELQKKLKEEEQRLNSQKQLELQLQLKLSKQKELRQLEKIRRESLEREKKFKAELQKEQLLRRQKQELVEKQKRQKQRLIEELKKKDLKEQIEQELRIELKSKNQNDTSRFDKSQIELIRSQKQAELSKQLQLLKLKQGVEIEQLRKENDLRERMLRLKKEEEELKRKQIEHLMKSAIQTEKQQIQRQSMKKRIEIEQNMRNNVKEKLLEQYRNEKEAEVEKVRQEREKQLEEQVYRDKIREKIERQMRMQAIQKTKQELQERQNRKYEVKSKLESVKQKFDKQIILDKAKIQEQVKKQLVEKVIFDKQAEKEAAKHDLRMQFEKELMASAIPQIYQNRNSYLLKNTNYLQGDLHLDSKLIDRPTNQKPEESKHQQKNSVKTIKNLLTQEQLHVYEKQKEKVSDIREDIEIKQPIKYQEEQGFQLLKVQSKKDQQAYDIRVIKKGKEPKEEEKFEKKKGSKKKKKKSESDSEDSEDRKPKKKKKQKKRAYYDESQDSEEVVKKKKKKQKKSSSQSPISSDEETEKRKKKAEKEKAIQEKSKLQKQQASKLQQKQAIVHFDAENKQKSKFNPIEQITIKPQKHTSIVDKYQICLQAIPQNQLDEYLEVHMSRIPSAQLDIQPILRQDLYRKLIGELTFCLLLGKFEGRIIGMALAYHDRSRFDLRKFTIVHQATYKSEDLKDFILSVSNFIFRKDPCDQIEFHYRYDESIPTQLEWSQDFNKWFDKYGSVYQKKVEETLFERKYVLKRQFNQKSQVVLGGVNKNTFRNIFTVYCGVLMSDSQMIQLKDDLIDTLSPENQISYAIMAAELFRTYLTPDEAEQLKNKVKQFVKLKEMLILVVMMQKKKLKLDELKLTEYKTLIELNMRLMSQGREIIRHCKDGGVELNRLYYSELNHSFNLPFHFQTTSLPVQADHQQIRQISYFRLSPLPPFKLHIIKSSLYNAEMNILPTENSKYKLFVINAQEYNEIKQSNHLDLFMYIRLFLKNVKSHNVAVWKYVWLPQMTDKGAWNLRQFKSFLNKDFYVHDSINISYKQFLPNALIIEPEHRDLVITPPFIVGVMSMGLEQVSEGSPLYARMIEVDALKTLEIQSV